MSLKTDSDLMFNADFKRRTVAAVTRAASDILAQTSNLPPNHASREAWARDVSDLSKADQQAGWMIPLIIARDSDLRFAYEQNNNQSDVGDASILNGVNSLIDDYADANYPV